MKLLYITQALDLDDPTLSVYHGWLAAIAQQFDRVEAVCLYEGRHELPANVSVRSLGKERRRVSSVVYAWRFMRLAWKLRHSYDAVFVHMNQEYVLLGGLFWKLAGKQVYMWRNHHAGNVLTDTAVLFCTKVFCTSKHSYTAKYTKTVLMPVGIDFEKFYGTGVSTHQPSTILFLARIAPSKRPEMLIDALGDVLARGVSFTAAMYGTPAEGHEGYARSLVSRAESVGLHDRLQMHTGVPHDATPAIYQAHDIFVNCSPSGMFDKTLFEAAAAGCRVIAASDDFHDAAGDEAYAPDTEALVERLIEALNEDSDAATRRRLKLQSLARGESLATLADQIRIELSV